MKDDNSEYNFVMKWTQDYPELQEMIDREMNRMIELSNFKEANEVIKMIKAKL
jgi:hypothetical protein